MSTETLLQRTELFPTSPGVYIMKDGRGGALYIGKAVNLRSRVRSYFQDTHEDRPHIIPMLERLEHIDWIATTTETEALILEANLVRTHKPPFNVLLRDDKHYPYLAVTLNEPFPRLVVARRVENNGAKYFGPFTDTRSIRRVMHYAKRIFRIRDCNRALPLKHAVRPCLNHAMRRCSGPCGGKIDQAAYRANVDRLVQFLRGKRSDLLEELETRMHEAAERLEFEQAASLRDQIQLVRNASRLQRVDLTVPTRNLDVFGIHLERHVVCVAVLHFRDGLLLSKRHFLLARDIWDVSVSDRDTMISEFYQDTTQDLPAEILIPETELHADTLEQWFSSRFQRAVKVQVPVRGDKRRLVELAEKNARLYVEQNVAYQGAEAMEGLKEALNLPSKPRTIEAFDISNIGESFAVAGMVHFENGAPRKSNYRRFKIAGVQGQNDFAMLMEAVTRRLSRLNAEGGTMPDLLLIDGGKGQLSAVRAALAAFEHAPMVASLAKQEEVLFSPYVDHEVRLEPTAPARRLVERIRDEVHRYALAYHKKLRGGQFRRSALEEIPGIGPKTARALLHHFGSMRRLREAQVEEIMTVKGINHAVASRLKDAIGAEHGRG